MIGISPLKEKIELNDYLGVNQLSDALGIYMNNGELYYNNTKKSYGPIINNNDVVEMILDLNNRTLSF